MKLPLHISTTRLSLRPFEMRDLEGYVTYYIGPRSAGRHIVQDRDRVVERFFAMAGQWALRGYGRYAITQGGVGFGHVGVLHMNRVPEITWSLWDAAYEGQGLASEAARAVLEAWVAANGGPLVAEIDPANTRSLRVAERLGLVEDAQTPTDNAPPRVKVFTTAQMVA